MATSTIHAVKLALRAALAARPALVGVQVTYGSPLPSPQPEFIWLGDAAGEQEARALGKQARREIQSLTLYVSVLRQGRDQQATTQRAFELVAEVEETLRADATLDATYTGPGQIYAIQVAGPFGLEERASDTQREALVTMTVRWTGRI